MAYKCIYQGGGPIMRIKVKQYDTVKLKDGRIGDVMEVNGDDSVDIDIGSSPKDWETLWSVPIDDIEKIIEN